MYTKAETRQFCVLLFVMCGIMNCQAIQNVSWCVYLELSLETKCNAIIKEHGKVKHDVHVG